MRKEYDLRALKVKRRGPLADVKAVESRDSERAKTQSGRAKSAPRYVKRAER